MFRWVAKLGMLKRVPLMPWLWDALMGIWNIAFHPAIAAAIDRIETQVTTWEGVTVTLHRYGGRQFNYHGREIGHIHSNGLADILLDRKTKQCLLLRGLVENHHTFPDSGWVSIQMGTDRSEETIIALMDHRRKTITA